MKLIAICLCNWQRVLWNEIIRSWCMAGLSSATSLHNSIGGARGVANPTDFCGNRDNLELNGMVAFHKSFFVGSIRLPLLL